MIVIADSGVVLWLSAVDYDGDLCLALWHRRQPGKVVLFALTKEKAACFGSPGGSSTGEGDVHHHSLDLDMNRVGVQISFEGVRAHHNITGLFGSGKLLWLHVRVLDNAGTVGAVEIEVDPGVQRLPNINDGLGAKGDGQLRAIVEIRVKIPPLVCAPAAFRSHTIFPELNLAPAEA